MARIFATGAYRDGEEGKLDYEGFFSPRVLLARAEYMHEHRTQSNGELRASDNWQAGIPLDAYMKSLWRHHMEVWLLHRGHEARDSGGKIISLKDALCAVMFNAEGYLHEHLRATE